MPTVGTVRKFDRNRKRVLVQFLYRDRTAGRHATRKCEAKFGSLGTRKLLNVTSLVDFEFEQQVGNNGLLHLLNNVSSVILFITVVICTRIITVTEHG